MLTRTVRSPVVMMVSLLLVAIQATSAASQSNSSSAKSSGNTSLPTTPRRLPMQHEVVAPFWTLEPGWSTQLEVSNNLTQEDLEVTPVLRTFDGTELPLPLLKIAHDQARTLDLQTLVPDLNGRANSYGSVLFRYKSISRGNLFATVFLQRLGQPISFHFDAFPLDPTIVSGSRESIWWLPHATADGYLVITNFTQRSVRARQVFTEGNKRDIVALTLGPYETRRISIRETVQRAGFKTTQGGLRVEFDGDAGSLHVSEFLFDEDAGFSALMRVFGRDGKAPREAITPASPTGWIGESRSHAGLPWRHRAETSSLRS